MKMATIIGARPQFIKASAISRVVPEFPGLVEILLNTGQHYDANMSSVFFEELGVQQPKYNFGIGNLSHGAMTGRQLESIESALLDERPDVVLVYGDTNSTLAGALAAAKLHIPVAHVEAGLRSFNRRMPEEINRVLADRISTWLFAPTSAAVENLRREGVAEATIFRVGDVMYDVALRFAQEAATKSNILVRAGLSAKGYVVATLHRAETTDDPARLAAAVGGLVALSKRLPVVLPLHPRTRQRIAIGEVERQLTLLEPLGYLDMTQLVRNAVLIVTDSGGLQKEAFFHSVPCVTLRDETEWIELVEAGWNRLQPPISADAVHGTLFEALDTPPGRRIEPYGQGDSAREILRILCGSTC